MPSEHSLEEGSFLSHYPEKTYIFFKNYYPVQKLKKKVIHVIFQHGMIEYHKRHEDLFKALRKAFGDSLVISTMDLFGHGQSGGQRGYIDRFETFTEDYEAFLKICLHRIYPDADVTPIFISHSLGGLITMKYFSENKQPVITPKACIFVNPCFQPKVKLPKELTGLVESLPETMLKLRIPLIYDAYDLSHDQAKAREFVRDHLISKSISLKLGLETLNACKTVDSSSYFFKYPSLFLLSEDDRVVELEKTRLFLTGMDKKLADSKMYPKMRHDLLNETCRNEVFEEIINYIKKFIV